MFAVGVDVSNGHSTVAVIGAKRNIVMKPFEVRHTTDGFADLAEKLNSLDGEIQIVMEHTGRYYESFAMSMFRAGFSVSAVNPLLLYICPMFVAASHRRGTSHCLSCIMVRQWSGVRIQEHSARKKVRQPAFHCAAFDLCRLSAMNGHSGQQTDRIGDG